MVLIPDLPVSPLVERHWESGWLLGVCSDGPSAIIRTGCAMGPVWVTFRALDQAPPDLADSMDGWEVGEEETLDITTDLTLTAPTSVTALRFEVPTRPGPHRLRVLARGRAEHYDHVVESPTEEYEITIWPVDQTEPRHRHGDDGLGRL